MKSVFFGYMCQNDLFETLHFFKISQSIVGTYTHDNPKIWSYPGAQIPNRGAENWLSNWKKNRNEKLN